MVLSTTGPNALAVVRSRANEHGHCTLGEGGQVLCPISALCKITMTSLRVGGTHVYLRQIHVVDCQKPSQYHNYSPNKMNYFLILILYLFSWLWSSLVAQTVKRLPTMWETQVRSLGQEDPLEKEMAPHSSTLAWKIPWTEESGRLQSTGSQRVSHDRATSLSL